MSHEAEQFLQLYKRYRYEDQYNYYLDRQKEFTRARTQAFIISIILLSIVALAGPFETVSLLWLKLLCLLAAAICPVLSAAMTGYNALYAFEQQAKLYQDALYNLQRIHVRFPVMQQGQSEADFTQQLNSYVQEVEKILQVEQGQWGQLAKTMKPPEM